MDLEKITFEKNNVYLNLKTKRDIQKWRTFRCRNLLF